jgi:hypothetical protein
MYNPVVLYGSKRWTLVKAIEDKLKIFLKKISTEDLWPELSKQSMGNK